MSLYQVGEYVVHPGQGVCMVDEIVHEPQEAYLLLSVSARNQTRISLPVQGESRLRPVLPHEEAQRLIDEYPQMPLLDIEARNLALEEHDFKQLIRNGSCRDAMCVVKTVRNRAEELRARNKRPPVAYERVHKQACERALAELAVALEETPDDVRTLFESRNERDFSPGL